MHELRQNFFTKEWVMIATDRAKRPEELATHHPPNGVRPLVATCPFCPGNEEKTPPEVLREEKDGPTSSLFSVLSSQFLGPG